MNTKLMMAMLAAGSVLTMTNAFAAAGTVNFNGIFWILPATLMWHPRIRWYDRRLLKTEFPTAGARTAATQFNIYFFLKKLSGNGHQCKVRLTARRINQR